VAEQQVKMALDQILAGCGCAKADDEEVVNLHVLSRMVLFSHRMKQINDLNNNNLYFLDNSLSNPPIEEIQEMVEWKGVWNHIWKLETDQSK
jgi:hypothetical protein